MIEALKNWLVEFALDDLDDAYMFQGKLVVPHWRFRAVQWLFKHSKRLREA